MKQKGMNLLANLNLLENIHLTFRLSNKCSLAWTLRYELIFYHSKPTKWNIALANNSSKTLYALRNMRWKLNQGNNCKRSTIWSPLLTCVYVEYYAYEFQISKWFELMKTSWIIERIPIYFEMALNLY